MSGPNLSSQVMASLRYASYCLALLSPLHARVNEREHAHDLCGCVNIAQASGGIDGTKLQLGDVLISVDGVSLGGKGLKELAELLRGEPRSMIDLELLRGWAQIKICAQLQRKGPRKNEPARPPCLPSADDGKSWDPSFRELPAPVFREMPAPMPSAASTATVSRDRPPHPADMGPLPAPGSRRPSPQSSMSSPGPGFVDNRSSASISRASGGGVTAQGTIESLGGRSPLLITPVASQMSMGSVTGLRAASPGASDNLVQRLSRQVERLDSEAKKREHEKQELTGLLRERDALLWERNVKLARMEEEAKRLRQELSEGADVEILKELRARVQILEADLRHRDAELAERAEHIDRLQRQLGATSATGSAMSFLNDLIGAKDKYTEEAQRAKEEAEDVKQRMEQVAQQNADKEKMIRDLEQARMSLSGKAQQDGQEAELLRNKVKSLEGKLEDQLHSGITNYNYTGIHVSVRECAILCARIPA